MIPAPPAHSRPCACLLPGLDGAITLALKQVPKKKLLLAINMDNETAQSVSAKIGLAKRYSLKGLALWRLGIVRSDELAQIGKSISLKK